MNLYRMLSNLRERILITSGNRDRFKTDCRRLDNLRYTSRSLDNLRYPDLRFVLDHKRQWREDGKANQLRIRSTRLRRKRKRVERSVLHRMRPGTFNAKKRYRANARGSSGKWSEPI